MVVWCRDDCIKEANKQLEDKSVYKDINFEETNLSNLVDKSNRIFKSFGTRKFSTEKEHRGNFSIKNKLEEQPSSKILTNDLVKLAEFALKKIFFEFHNDADTQHCYWE